MKFKAGIATLILLVLFITTFCQEAKTLTESHIRTLIKKSRSNDLITSGKAKQELSKLNIKYVPTLIKILKKGKPCDRVETADLIIELDKSNKELVPILTALATGGNLFSLFNLQEEMGCRRKAAFLLAFSTDGIRALIKMLKEGDLFEQQSAIFAFDDLTETANYPEGSTQAMIDAIPFIAESGKSKDEVMQDMSNEVLQQIVNVGPKELMDVAKKYVNENQ
jgi:hypothetical protein